MRPASLHTILFSKMEENISSRSTKYSPHSLSAHQTIFLRFGDFPIPAERVRLVESNALSGLRVHGPFVENDSVKRKNGSTLDNRG